MIELHEQRVAQGLSLDFKSLCLLGAALLSWYTGETQFSDST